MLQSVEATITARAPSQPGPALRLLSLSSSRLIGLCLGSKVVRQSPTWRQSAHKTSYCFCSCFALVLALLIALLIAVMIRSS